MRVELTKENLTNGKKPIYKETYLFILFYAISRIFTFFIPGGGWDFCEIANWGDAILKNMNIYSTFPLEAQGLADIKFPPLYFVQIAIILFFFGFNLWSIRLGFTCCEIFTMVLLYYFSKQYLKAKRTENDISNNKSLLVLYIYAFSPITILTMITASYYFLGQIYMIAGLFAFFQRKIKLTAFVFCLGFMTEIYPIFCLIPICILFLCQKRWKDLGMIILIFVNTFILFSVPFILLSPNGFLFNYFTHLYRTPQTISFWSIFLVISGVPLAITLFNFNISYLAITFISFVVIYSIFCYFFFKKHPTIDMESISWVIIVFYLFLPIIFLSIDLRYLYWIFPFICLFFNGMHLKMLKKLAITTILFSTIIGLSFLFSGMAFQYNGTPIIWLDQRIFIPNDLYLGILQFEYLFFIILEPAYLIIWIYYGKLLKSRESEYRLPNLFQSFSILTALFSLEWYFWGSYNLNNSSFPIALVWIIIVGSNLVGFFFILKQIKANWPFKANIQIN